jgi:hypothetical protein
MRFCDSAITATMMLGHREVEVLWNISLQGAVIEFEGTDGQ